MTYDSLRGALVLFGGFTTEAVDEMWEWNGREWIERTAPFPTPPARWGAAITFDPIRGRVLMFGGYDIAGQELRDFWEWDGQRWFSNELTVEGPAERGRASMTYDRFRRVAVMFGGRSRGAPSGETWEWNGERWTLASFGGDPTPRDGAPMAFDESRGETVMIGRVDDGNTWLWNGARWATLGGLATPSQFHGASMVYDRSRARPLLFGGATDPDPSISGGTWELVGSEWVQRNPEDEPPPRELFGMAYVDDTELVIVFGGSPPSDPSDSYNDLWLWDGITWREWQ